jgi:hypothetical protein
MTNKNGNKVCPVQLELELETVASNWGIRKRLDTAAKLRRYARQLEVSAYVMINRSFPESRPQFSRASARRKAYWN